IMLDVLTDYRAWAKANSYNRREAAEVIGVEYHAIGAWERGESAYPAGGILVKIMQAIYPQLRDSDARINSYTCGGCKAAVPGPQEHASYCCECGERFGVGCAECAHISVRGSKFCAECGSKLT